MVSGGDGYITKSYELLITDVGSGGETDENGDRLDWVTFTNFATQMSDNDGKPYTPEMLIKEGDTFTRVDNLTDPDRKGIVTMMTVGNNTPYMDVRYGLKTDPKNNLKSRIGNLEGIRNDIFGWLEGFGIYTTNYYGIGHFINAQTGENVQARQEMTLERFHSFYQETTYNISEEDNFLTNGFFQKELESWQRCEADGTPVADEPESMLLGTVEESGEAMMPLMINGQMLSVANRRVADITDLDGIKLQPHLIKTKRLVTVDTICPRASVAKKTAAKNTIASANKKALTLTFTPATGLVSGSFSLKMETGAKTFKFSGVVMPGWGQGKDGEACGECSASATDRSRPFISGTAWFEDELLGEADKKVKVRRSCPFSVGVVSGK